jgi:hypothetical protein
MSVYSYVREFQKPAEPQPTADELAQKAATEKAERLRQNAAKIIADQKAAADAAAAQAEKQARQLNIQRVNLCIDQALLVASDSERSEVFKRVGAKHMRNEVLAMDAYTTTSLFADTLAEVRESQ